MRFLLKFQNIIILVGDNPSPLIVTTDLCRDFRIRGQVIKALQNFTIRIENGELVAIVGPNGAGKTTFVKILSTVLPPTSGTASVNGFDVTKNGRSVRNSLGILFGTERGFNNRLNGFDNLLYWLILHDLSLSEAKLEAKRLLNLVGLFDNLNIPFMKLGLYFLTASNTE